MKVKPDLVEYVIKNFDKDDSESNVRAILDCMKVELRRDMKKSRSKEEATFCQTLIDQIETPDFWYMLDWANYFEFQGP
ncbi:MAG: hypothetical protein WC789_07420 [Lentisphaeria bacterium]|jgi:hypothetical protein